MNDPQTEERINQLQNHIVRLEHERDHLSDCLAKALDQCSGLRVIAEKKMRCYVCGMDKVKAT